MKLILKYFFGAIKKFKTAFIVPLMLMIVMALLSAFTPYFFRIFADNLSDDLSYLIVGLIIFAVYLLVQTLIKMLWNYLLDGFGGRYIKYLSVKAEKTLISARFSDIETRPENLKHILYYDVLSVYSVIAVQLPMAVKSLIVTLFAAAAGFFFGAIYAAVIVSAFVIGLFISFASRKMIAAASRRTNEKMKEHSAVSSEFVDNLALSQTNSLGKYYADRTSRSIDDFIATAKREDLRTYFWYGIVENYNQLFSIVLSALLAMPFAGGSVVNLVFFTMLADIVMTQGMSVQSSLLGIMKTRVCFENIESVLNVKVREGQRSISGINEIEFKDISFSYDGEHFVFSNFNCVLKCGDAVRIDGANGSGKSTFAKLLCGLYAPQSGEILFDGVPLTDIVRGDVNAQILYIGQEEPLLNERLSRYLTIIAGRAIEGEEFEQICKAADFSDGDITILQEGKNLSPGQRKKIMMMKYLLLKEGAAVIILDELFAGLDYFARHKFAEMLNCEIARGDKIYILTEHTDTGVNVTRVVDLELSGGQSCDKIAVI